MKITRDNYEPFFLDYLEGNLDENYIDQFLDFLEQNPDLKEELQLFDNIHLPQEQVLFKEKEQLYKPVLNDASVFEMKTIAFLEGDLDAEDRKSFESYMALHPELQKEYELFAKTRLVADTEIKFPKKHKLYKKSGTIVLMNWVARAAAVLVLVWGISSLFRSEVQTTSTTINPEIAAVKPLPETEIKNNDREVKIQEAEVHEKIASAEIHKPIGEQKQSPIKSGQKSAENATSAERDLTTLETIAPLLAQLEPEPAENQLAVSRSIDLTKLNDPQNIMTLDEFLVSRAKKIGNEGLFSAQRILRTGLNVASELSGDRIGYSTKDGKIRSLEFESKLMAFSVPL
jgi:hypothetical protein